MKNMIWVVLLAVSSLVLAIALIVSRQNATETKVKDADHILTLSNSLVRTTGDLEEQRQVNLALTGDLNARNATLTSLSNTLKQTKSTLDTTSASLDKTEQSLKETQDELAKRDAKIAALESQNQELDQKALELSTTITNLNIQIAETQRKLDSAEGDREYLQAELKRLMAEKAELEKRFNDLEVLRAQVKKLKEELNVARRLDWIRRGIFGNLKGGELMMKQVGAPQAPKETNEPRYDLNVEVQSDGTIRVIPALTNAPADANQ